MELGREIGIEEPEVVLRGNHVLAADEGDGIELRGDAGNGLFARNLEFSRKFQRRILRVMLERDAELRRIGRVGKVRILHVAAAEEVDAVPHAVPARVGPVDVLGIPGEAPGIALPPVGRKTRGPGGLEGVRGDDEAHDAEGDLHEARHRTPGLAAKLRDKCIKARGKEAGKAEEHHDAPEDDLSPHLGVDAEDVEAEALAHVTGRMVAEMAEGRVEAHGRHDEHRGEILGLEAVAHHEERHNADEGHLFALPPAERAGRVAHQVAEDQVCDANRQEDDEKPAPADDVVPGLGFGEVLIRNRSRIIRHSVFLRLKIYPRFSG